MGSVGPNGIESGLVFAVDAANAKSSFQNATRSVKFDRSEAAPTQSLKNLDSSLNPSVGADFSFGGWYYFNDTVASVASSQWGAAAAHWGIEIIYFGSAIVVAILNEAQALDSITSSSKSINTWLFCVTTYDGSTDTIKLYVDDDVAISKVSAVPFDPPDTASFNIGSRDQGTPALKMTGRADNNFFYDKVLSASEVSDLYNVGLGKAYNTLSATQKVSLVSWWSLNETSDNRVDSHGSNDLISNTDTISFDTGKVIEGPEFFYAKNMIDVSNGTPQNGVELIDGAWEFDGVNDYIDFGNLEVFNVGFNNYSISIWCNPDTISGGLFQNLLNKEDDNEGIGIWFSDSYNGVGFEHGTGGGGRTPVSCNLRNIVSDMDNSTTPFNITYVEDDTNGSIYFNNELVGQSVKHTRSGTAAPAVNLRIGATQSVGHVYGGTLNSLNFFNKALTPSEISQNYDNLKYRFR